MSYPPGAFQALCAIDDQRRKADLAYSAARITRSKQLREAAEKYGNIEWHNGQRLCSASAIETVADDLPPELLNDAVRAWMLGDMDAVAQCFYSACEIAFEQSVEFFANCDAEFCDD